MTPPDYDDQAAMDAAIRKQWNKEGFADSGHPTTWDRVAYRAGMIAGRAAALPREPTYDDLQAALARMCEPLDPSRLSGVTAQEDARCMAVIRDGVAALREQVAALNQPVFKSEWQELTERAEKAEADNAALLGLLIEWEDGMYDGMDFLRRVRLALHCDKGLIDAAMREVKG